MLDLRRLPSVFAAAAVLLSAPAHAADKLTVLLDWFLNPDHGPLVIARDKGYLREADLDVTFVEPADPNNPPKWVAAKQAEVAVSYQPQHHVQVSQGLPLVRFGTLVATPLNSLVALADGPVRSLSDLKGRKVGYSVGGFEDMLLGAMLESVGLSLKDVELINVNFSLSPSLVSRQVDAVVGAFRNFELNQMAIAGRPGRAFFPEEHGVPAYDELILVTHRDLAGDPRLRRLVDAIERAVRFIVNHPQESWETFRAADRKLDDELNRRAWLDTVPRFALRPAALDTRRYIRFADFLKARGLVAEVPPLESYAIELR